MRVLTVEDCLALDPGETIPSVKGKICALFERKTGTNSTGEWSLQNGELMDASGKIKFCLVNREELDQSWRGRTVYIQCHEGDRGMTGVKLKEDDYRKVEGIVKKMISITATAQIDIAEGSSQRQAAPAPAPAKSNAQPKQTAAPAQPAAKPTQRQTAPMQQRTAVLIAASAQPSTAPSNDAAVRKALNKLANLYLHCLMAGSYVRGQWEANIGGRMTEEQFQACVSSIYIQATRMMLDGQLAAGSFQFPGSKPANEEPVQPETAPEPELPPVQSELPTEPEDDDVPF